MAHQRWGETPKAVVVLDGAAAASEQELIEHCRGKVGSVKKVTSVEFVTERLNGDDGLGGIFPAMANSLMMYSALGYPPDHPHSVTARSAVEKLVVRDGEEFDYCQPCLSPVWDTVLAGHALMDVGETAAPVLGRAFDWIEKKQVLDVVDRAYLLEVGAIKLSGTAAELKGNSFIREAYMGL